MDSNRRRLRSRLWAWWVGPAGRATGSAILAAGAADRGQPVVCGAWLVVCAVCVGELLYRRYRRASAPS